MSNTSMNIVETAAAVGTFKTFVAAVTAAALGNTLKGTGPFTVLAPTDEAFAKLPAGMLDDLSKPENKGQLAKILKLHVIAGRIGSRELIGKKMSQKSLVGEELRIDGSKGIVISGATVETSDIECSNGLIHVIDTVILPASYGAAEAA